MRNTDTGQIVNAVEYSSVPNVRHDLSAKLSDNQLVQFETVCFCDIPLEHLALHCRKYSYFGISFSKTLLVKKGASPVMYVPRSGAFDMELLEHHAISGELHYQEPKSGQRGQLFDELFEMHNRLGLSRYQDLETQMFSSEEHDHIDRVLKDLRTMLFYQTAVEAALFGHLKFFDPSLPRDHLDNYYMEREWRISGRLKFTIGDIQRAIVPPNYMTQLITAFPELGASVTPIPAG